MCYRLSAFALVLVCGTAPGNADMNTTPLENTKPLEAEGDLAEQMVSAIDQYLMRALAASAAGRCAHWRRDYASHGAYVESVAPNRDRLAAITGAVDTRLPPSMEIIDTVAERGPLAEAPGYRVFPVRWPVFENVYGEGLLLMPKVEPVASVVALPDCDWTPEQLVGISDGVPERAQFARRLAESGCRVLVPVLLNRRDTFSGLPGVKMTNQPHREFIYRGAFEMGRHIIGYEVQKVRAAIIDYFIFIQHPDEGYRQLTYMMMDADIVAASPSTVYLTLKAEGLLGRRDLKPSKKGTGFAQPLRAHDQWHVDVTYVNLSGTFYYLCSVLDGYSRYIVYWELRETMKEIDVELIVQRALEAFPGAHPRLISDNGPQFIARGFKEFIRLAGMTHVRTNPYYPQSNGKQERMQRTVKRECIRRRCPRTVQEALRWLGEYIDRYNTRCLHSALGYITPLDMLEGRRAAIHARRERKLETARERRRSTRQLNHHKLAM